MRVISLVTAALAATFAFVAPAAAQGSPETIQKLCPDLSYNQIKTELAALIEDYDFDSDPTLAAQQAASLLCQYGAGVADADQADDAESAETTRAHFGVIPPPQHGQRFRVPPPRGFVPPRKKVRPYGYHPQPRYPRHGYAPRPLPPQAFVPGHRRPAPSYYGRPAPAPRMVTSGARRYGGGYYRESAPPPASYAQAPYKTEQGAPRCEIKPAPRANPETRVPYAPGACQLVDDPNMPDCQVWRCKRPRY